MGNLLSNGTVTVRRHEYAHITNSNTNVVKTIVGPQRYRLSLSESCTFGPEPFVSIPFQCYCIVENPVKHAVGGDSQQPVLDEWGQAEIRMGDKEVRTTNVPFPLYPGETITCRRGSRFRPVTVIPANTGLHLRSVLDFVDETTGKVVHAAEEWMEEGPKVYLPRTWVEEVGLVPAQVIEAGCALRLRATSNFTDRHGNERVAGEEWLVRTPGSYLPAVQEHVVETVTGVVLQKACALQLRAKQRFTDVYGKARNAGDMWLVTSSEASVHIPDVHEEVIKVVNRCALTSNRYCVVLNPVGADGRNRYGEREVRRGECSFFLKPGEELQGGIRDVVPVSRGDALLLKALEPVEVGGVMREPGSEWLLHGPAEDVPSNSVAVVEHRKMITLDKNEGIYVMNKKTGEVRTVIGQPYMPTEEEVLWEKHLPMAVEELLTSPGGSLKTSQRRADFVCTRELHRMVRFNVKHNAAVQIYDYHKKIPRIVFGPDLVMLGPHEELTVLSLSGGTPKAPNAIQSLQLFLGPRFSSDTIIVETSDHARLQLRLSYNWFFDVKQDAKDEEQQKCRCFAVPDFIGDCCKTIASRVRGAVAAEDFDSFHKNSAMIIRTAVFGVDEKNEIRKELRFPANDFVVTNVDVQFAEPTDAKTRDSLQKSVQLAIEITTKSLEATARHGNELKDQEAKGQLERQKLLDKIEVEKAKTKWLELQAKSEAVQASGQSVTEAQAKAEALLIEVDSELKQATLRSQAYKISAESELKKLEQRQAMELDYVRRQNALEIERARRQAESEAEKVRRMVGAVGKDTLVAIARAGPETQAKLLAGLGLRGYLITDGNSPVNLFSAAQSMLGEPGIGHGSDSTSS